MKLFIKTTVFFSITLFLSTHISADPLDTLWVRTYGGASADYGRGVQKTSDGGFIIVGETWSFGMGWNDVYLVKIDSLGNYMWAKTYGGDHEDCGYSVQQTNDNGYIISGMTMSFGVGWNEVYLIKTDVNGDVEWTESYGWTNSQNYGYSVQQISDGGYIIGGSSVNQALLIKTDSLGNEIWTKEYGWSNYSGATSVQQTSDGGYILGGFYYESGNHDFFLVKTDENGDTLWTKHYHGQGDDRCYCVRQTSDGGYIAVGGTHMLMDKRWGSDVFLIKTDADGNDIWAKTYGDISDDVGYSVEQTSDGGYVIAAHTYAPGVSLPDVYVVKTDINGDTLWTGAYGGEGNEFGYSAQQASDGGYIIVGWTDSFGPGYSAVYAIKTVRDTIGVEEKNDMFPQQNTHFLEIDQNPFVDKVTIKYHLGNSTSNAMLKIYNISGQLAKHFNLSNQPIGHIVWNGSDDSGIYLPGGVYFVQLVSSSANVTTSDIITKKVVKLR